MSWGVGEWNGMDEISWQAGWKGERGAPLHALTARENLTSPRHVRFSRALATFDVSGFPCASPALAAVTLSLRERTGNDPA